MNSPALPPGAIDLRPRCILRLELHVCDPQNPGNKEIQIWASAPVTLETGRPPDPLALNIVNPQDKRQVIVRLFILGSIEKCEDGVQVATYLPLAILRIDPTLDALSQAGFRPQVITTGEKKMVVIPGAKA